jgi:hypothetical protein
MLYSNKSLDDISRAIDQYIENYKDRTGVEFNAEEAQSFVNMLKLEIMKKRQDMFEDIFGTYTAKSLRDALSIAEKPDLPISATHGVMREVNSI